MTAPGRVSLLENVRGVLIALVVMGHSLEPLFRSAPLARALYTALYVFHVPAFAFLSGHLSRPEWDRKALASIAWSLLAPFFVFHVLYVAFDARVLAHGWNQDWLARPYWLLWFLWSLACWRLMLPLLRRLPMPLGVSVLIAVGAGLVPWVGYVFGLSRTFVFLPCFVAGHLARREWLPGEGPRHRVLAGALFVALGGLVWAIASEKVTAPNPLWLYGSASYAVLGVGPLTGMATRLALLGCALALTWALFRVCPRGDSVLTLLGRRSLPTFLLHGFVVRGVEVAGVYSELSGVSGVLLALTGGAVLALLLSHPLVVGVTRPLWEPRRLFGRV